MQSRSAPPSAYGSASLSLGNGLRSAALHAGCHQPDPPRHRKTTNMQLQPGSVQNVRWVRFSPAVTIDPVACISSRLLPPLRLLSRSSRSANNVRTGGKQLPIISFIQGARRYTERPPRPKGVNERLPSDERYQRRVQLMTLVGQAEFVASGASLALPMVSSRTSFQLLEVTVKLSAAMLKLRTFSMDASLEPHTAPSQVA